MKIIYVVMLVFFFSGCSNLDSLVSDINKTITTNKKSEPTQVKKSVPKTQVKKKQLETPKEYKKQERIQNNTPKIQERQSIKREI
ncbi:hypothetical protein [Fusobacterium mortiferum]|uniref:hypothetical protein n=1 Tax=Fusobacterium mortiferum TaxID=850 RepID=UPI003F8F5A3F